MAVERYRGSSVFKIRGLLSCWARAPFGLLRRVDGRSCADVFRHEIGVLAKAIAGAFDLDNDRVVEEAVEKGRGDNMVAEHFSPFGEAAVRCQDHDVA